MTNLNYYYTDDTELSLNPVEGELVVALLRASTLGPRGVTRCSLRHILSWPPDSLVSYMSYGSFAEGELPPSEIDLFLSQFIL